MSAYERVVLVDDDREALTLMKNRLVHGGYAVETFRNSAEAIKEVRKNIPDIIVLDVKMPHLNGFEVCDLLRKDLRTHHIPIILVSGVDEAKEQIRNMNAEGVYHLEKPFQGDNFLDLIRTALDCSVEN